MVTSRRLMGASLGIVLGFSLATLKIPAAARWPANTEEKPTADKTEKAETRRGSATGVVTAKGDAWIEVLAVGEEKARRYVPHWRGGAPKDGGGPDKDMVAQLKDIPIKARVRLEWAFEERVRVEKIEILKKAD